MFAEVLENELLGLQQEIAEAGLCPCSFDSFYVPLAFRVTAG